MKGAINSIFATYVGLQIKVFRTDLKVFRNDPIQIEYFKGFYVLLNIQWNTLTPRAGLIKTSKLPIKRRKTKRCVKTVIKRFGTRTNWTDAEKSAV